MSPSLPDDPRPETERLYALVRDALATRAKESAAPPTAEAVGRLYERLETDASTSRPARTPSSSSVQPTRHLWRALGLSVLGAAAVIALAVRVSDETRSTVSPQTNSYATRGGQRATVELDDGSKIQLAPSTTVFVTRTRDGVIATVSGEAMFTVAHDQRAPFTVHTSHAVTRVLGTQFSVRQYPDESSTRVVVLEGRVGVGPTHATGHRASAVLGARMVATISDSAVTSITTPADVDSYVAWTDGRLVFHRTSASDVIREIGRVYGVNLELADSSLARQPITWTVSIAQDSRDQVLDLLGALLDAHIVRSADGMRIVPGRQVTGQRVRQRTLTSDSHDYGR